MNQKTRSKLIALRLAAGMTIRELSVHSQVNHATITDLEAGRTPKPQMKTIRRLAKALGVDIMELLNEVE